MIQVKIIKDSTCSNGSRLTTFVLTYPRYIHAELMTHRVFSRNSASSRAIPVKKLLKNIIVDKVEPLVYTRNRPGMQGGEPLSGITLIAAKIVWSFGKYTALLSSYLLDKLGLHKQYSNRITEPYSNITVVLTSSQFSNFFNLRFHKDAQPEIQELAKKMYFAMTSSTPQFLKDNEWHLPFVDSKIGSEKNIIESVAKCARVSYLNHDGSKSTYEQDKALYMRLVGSVPKHCSPLEHQATPMIDPLESIKSGNLVGWIQYRKLIEHENVREFQLDQ